MGVGLTTLATLLLELSLTRIFSVVFYYHFAFLAISIALFGLGAGGVLSYMIVSRGGKVFSTLGMLSTANALLVPGALIFLLTRTGGFTNATLAIIYFTTALPFVLAGAIVSMAISETIERIEQVYFFDLMGAAAGCLLLVPFLSNLGGPNTVIASAVLFAAAGAVWFHVEGRIQGRAAAVLLGLALTALVVINIKQPIVEVRYAKDQQLPKEVFTKWNEFSRVAVNEEGWIVIDADANTWLSTFDIDNMSKDAVSDLMSEGPALPYRLKRGGKTLIIGAGGGKDVARALASGSRDVTAVEINPIIANTIMREKFAQKNHGLFNRPQVRVFVEDGRSFVRRSEEKYQIIQATLVDTWASTAAGAFALTENNLYTTDAFYDYLSHLSNDGVLAFTRWGFQPPRESLRLLSLAREALLRLGETNPAAHIIVGRENARAINEWGATDTVIITRKPIPAQDLSKVVSAIGSANLIPIYFPGNPFPTVFSEYLFAKDPAAFYANYPYDITPVSDNRPFFFYTVQPRDVMAFLQNAYRNSADFKINRAVPMLLGLVGISLLATLVTIALPPLVLRTRLPKEPGLRRYLVYFVLIGTGYILIQVALIQKFVLFLGHPTYALTVIIFSMLLSSGLGSFYSRRILEAKRIGWAQALVAVAVLVVVVALVSGYVTQLGVGWPLWLKAPVAALLIAPAAFFMGIPFPTGLAYLEKRHSPSVRWAWSLNAASSVMGSALAMLFALYMGLLQTLILGGVFYVLASLIVRSEQRRAAA